MRVVLDTNVYISALLFGGVCDDILACSRSGIIQVFTSPALIKELEGVLKTKFDWSPREVQKLLHSLSDYTRIVEPKIHVNVIRNDPADNRVLECARAAGAHCIITGDADLKKLKRYKNITILSPREFFEFFIKTSHAYN